jgi:hypothetical protein
MNSCRLTFHAKITNFDKFAPNGLDLLGGSYFIYYRFRKILVKKGDKQGDLMGLWKKSHNQFLGIKSTSRKNWATAIIKKTTQSKISVKGRKIAESGHPGNKKARSEMHLENLLFVCLFVWHPGRQTSWILAEATLFSKQGFYHVP